MRLAGFLILCCLAIQSAFAAESNLTLTVDGVTYSNVTFGTATPSSVSVRHSTGVASIPLEKLSPELQKRFGYDPQKAAASRQEEAKQLELARQQQELARQEAEKRKERVTAAVLQRQEEEQKRQEEQRQEEERQQREWEKAKLFFVKVVQALPEGALVRDGGWDTLFYMRV
jgi:serine phosphatase RsbU (regulator of sigma subunit)